MLALPLSPRIIESIRLGIISKVCVGRLLALLGDDVARTGLEPGGVALGYPHHRIPRAPCVSSRHNAGGAGGADRERAARDVGLAMSGLKREGKASIISGEG